MSKRLVPLNWRLMQDDGITPATGVGALRFYVAGTTTPATVYEDRQLTNPIGTSIDIDSIGYPEDVNVWGSDAISYKVGILATGVNGGAEKFEDYLTVGGSPSEAYLATGSSTAFAVTTGLFAGSIPTYSTISIVAPASITTPNITLDADGTGPVQIKKRAGYLLSVYDIFAGGLYDLMFDGVNWVLQNPTSPVDYDAVDAGVRLSLVSNLAVPVSDQTAKSEIYVIGRKGLRVPIYSLSASAVKYMYMGTVQLLLDSNAGHALYHQSGKNYDVFAFESSTGVARIGSGAAWTDDVTRSDGITRTGPGLYWNTAQITLRYGSNSGDTATVDAGCATYLGTFRCTANGQTEDSKAKRFLWNMYNRAPRAMSVYDATDSWNYTTATIRQANGSTANQLAFVRGLDEDAVSARSLQIALNTNAGVVVVGGIGLDSTTAITGFKPNATTPVANYRVSLPGAYDDFPGLGYHFLSLNEYSNASGTTTWYGDAGAPPLVQSGIEGVVMA